MKLFWFKPFLGGLVLLILAAGISGFLHPVEASAANQTGVIITVTYSDPINVRGGPNTVDYPIVGRLGVGETAPALGVSPKREWVQIAYPSAPNGTGWVYAAYVTVSGGELQIVEPPPTSTPVISTVDPTLAAAFSIQPTQTRMPTFTPPPPLIVPTFRDESSTHSTSVFGIFIVTLTLLGGIGLLISFLLRK